MPDWLETLEQVAGGISGIPKGLTLGAAPFDAWEKIRTQDLANDRSDILLRDLGQLQNQRDIYPDYYRNQVGAADVGSRLASSKGEADIYGVNRNLAMQKAISDPNGPFMQMMQAKGIGPGDPEFQTEALKFMAQSDPFGAIAGYNASKIPQMQDRNMNIQAAMAAVLAEARTYDPNARMERNPDGTFKLITSMGNLEGPSLVKAASMIMAKTPQDAIEQGIKTLSDIQYKNAQMYELYQRGRVNAKEVYQGLQQERIAVGEVLRNVTRAIEDIEKNTLLSDEQKAERKAQLVQQRDMLQQRMLRIGDAANALAQRQGVPSMASSGVSSGRDAFGMPEFGGYPQAQGGAEILTGVQSPGGPSLGTRIAGNQTNMTAPQNNAGGTGNTFWQALRFLTQKADQLMANRQPQPRYQPQWPSDDPLGVGREGP